MASAIGHDVPLGLPHRKQIQETAGVGTASSSSGEKVAGDNRSSDPTSSSLLPEASGSAQVKTTRTRTVKSRAIFTPEDESEKKTRGRARGRRRKRLYRGSDLKNLLEDEKADPGQASPDGKGDGLRKRSRNASDEENRWDHIRSKVKNLLQKMRRDTHFIQVYQQDGWKSSGREKLKPTIELEKAKARVRGVKTELRQVAKRLTEMNPSGSRWGGLQQDDDGNIRVDEVVCTKCNQGHSDDHDDILLCDYAGCFRAYHQNCLTPSIKPEAFPNEEEDWFCWQCECLTDCLEMIEEEFPGSQFESWEEVFPGVESGAASESRQDQAVLLTDSEDSDDESFKGSTTESEDEDAFRKSPLHQGGDNHSGPGESGAGRERDGSINDEETEEDEDMVWMSDAESVGSDEVAKLHSEAADMADVEDDAEPPDGAESRASRARTRRQLRSKALGLPNDTPADRALAAAIVRGEKIDTANIMEGRRRRKAVDYVKLNEIVFGDEEVYGDQQSSGTKIPETSAAYGSDVYEGSDSREDSDTSELSFEMYKPKRKSTPSIDPLTGEKRKRGRPRKSETALANGGGAAGGQPKLKPGRPKKSTGAKAAEHHSDKTAHINSVPATATDNIPRGRAHGVSMKDTLVREHGAGSSSGKRRRGRPRKSDMMPGISRENGSKDDAGSSTGKSNSCRPRKPQVPISEENITDGGTGVTTLKRKPGRPRKHVSTPGIPQGGISIGGAGNYTAERSPAHTGAIESTLDSSRAGGVEEGAIRTKEKRKPGRPKKDGAIACSPRKSGAGAASSSPAKRTPAQPMAGDGASNTTTEKRKRGRPRKDGGPVRSRLGKIGGDGAGSGAVKRTPAQPRTNISPLDSAQGGVTEEGASSMIERRKPGRPKKDGATPNALQGGGCVGSTGSSAAKRPPAQSVKDESTLETAQAGVLGGGKSSFIEKRKRGRPRKDGGSSRSSQGRVDLGGTSNGVEKLTPAQPGTDWSNVATSSTQAIRIERCASNISQKRKPGRPRKDGGPSGFQKDISGTNSAGKRTQHAQPGTDESILSTTQASRIEGGASTTSEKRNPGWLTEDAATSSSTNGKVGLGVANSSTGKRPDVHLGKKLTHGTPEGVVVNEGSSSTTENRKTSRPRKDETILGSLRGEVGEKYPNLARDESAQDTSQTEEGYSSVAEKLKLNRDRSKPLPNTQHKNYGNGEANFADSPKPVQSREEEAIRGTLRQFIAEDGAGCSLGKSNSSGLKEGEPIPSSSGKHKPDRPRKHAAANNALLHEVDEGAGSCTGKRKPGRPIKDGAVLEDGSGCSRGKRKRGRPRKNAVASDMLRNSVAGDGSSSSVGKRQSGQATKAERLPGVPRDYVAEEGAGSSEGKRKPGRPKKSETMSPVRTKKHKADLTTKLEDFPASPRRDIGGNSASVNTGKRKPGRSKKNKVIPDAIEKGGASSGTGEPQEGPTVGKEPVRDAAPTSPAGHCTGSDAGSHITAKRKSGRPRKFELPPEVSRFAHISVANGTHGTLLTQRRGRGRPRKDAGVVDGRNHPDNPAPAVCPPAKKQRTASGAAAAARNEDDGHDELKGGPAASGMDNEHPRMSPSSWTLNSGHTEPSKNANASSPAAETGKGADGMISGIPNPVSSAQSPCVTSDDWNGDRNQAPESSEEAGAHISSGDGASAGSTQARAVSYVFTPMGRKAVVKRD